MIAKQKKYYSQTKKHTNSLNAGKPTTDQSIRTALMMRLKEMHARDSKVRIIQELGINNGSHRVDIAVINGVMHGYEIKSDKDSLLRLSSQASAYSGVFDKVTLVVGADHVIEALHIVPDWWAILLAKSSMKGKVELHNIRDNNENLYLDRAALARLLWKDEALNELQKAGFTNGYKSKHRDLIYEKLAEVVAMDDLRKAVRNTLFFRENWRPDQPLMLNDG